MAMTVRTNKSNPPKKKKGGVIVRNVKTIYKRGPAPSGGSKVDLGFEHGAEKKTYIPERKFTGDTRYGKDNPKAKDPEFIEKARKAGADVAHGPDGKPYAAGRTTVDKTPNKVTVKISKAHIPTPVKPEYVEETKKAASPKNKLKPMGMTYGTDDPSKGGGTRRKMKVRTNVR